MKRAISLVLVLIMCLTLCACGKTQESRENNSVHSVSETNEQSDDNVIEFDSSIVVAEDEFIRVELLKFYQDYYIWDDFGTPIKVSQSTEGARLEKFVTLKFYNKCDHKLRLYMDDIYLGNDGASLYLMAAKVNPDAGKNITASYLIRTGEKETLNSMEELHLFEGEFLITHEYGDGTQKNPHKLKFSIPKALDGGNENELSISDNSDAWLQFWDYLQEHGPVTVVTKKTDTGHNQVTITATADAIQIKQEGENATVSGKVTAHAINSMSFDLPANAQNVTAQIEYWVGGTDENGTPQVQSSSPQFSWDIQNYRSGDKVSVDAEYTWVDGNDQSTKKGYILATGALVEVTDVLSQALAESGLNICMADLGFTNF